MDRDAEAEGGDRRLKHLVEANARRLPVLEAKLRVLLRALNEDGVGTGLGVDGGARGREEGAETDGGRDSDGGNASEMLEVLETRIANQQAEWNAQNDEMEKRLANLAEKRTADAAAQQRKAGVSSVLAWRLWAWMKQNTKLSVLLALILLFVLRRRRLL